MSCVFVIALPLLALSGTALSAPMPRPTHEPWSDGPTHYLKHQIRTGSVPDAARRTALRLKALDWGDKMTIPTNPDMRNFLEGMGVRRKIRSSNRGRSNDRLRRVYDAQTQLPRVRDFLQRAGLDSTQQNRLAELMLWRNLAYGSGTLAHGRIGPGDAADAQARERAMVGLRAGVDASFRLGARLRRAVTHGDARSLTLRDILDLHAASLAGFPEKEPGQFRNVNFEWPVNSFGVDFPKLHGSHGEIARFQRQLEGRERETLRAFSRRPLHAMAKVLYWLHNIHPCRDGNGRVETLLGWSLAQAAGWAVPPEYDSAAGGFKLAATKWGGTALDLRDQLAEGALDAERFARVMARVLSNSRIISRHVDQGAVGAVVAEDARGGPHSLLVMFPATEGSPHDPELMRERSEGRVVWTGGELDPSQLRIEVSINGKDQPWHTVAPEAVHTWSARYPWQSTTEPIFRVVLPYGYRYANFRVLGPDGGQLGAADYYMNLEGES